MEIRAINATVRGVVQGVGFRYWTRREAQRLGLVGWVRNRPDGSVEVRAQGPPDAVAALVEFLETGPSHARVTSVEGAEVTADPALTGFDVTF